MSAGQLLNVFSTAEIDTIRSVLDKLPDHKNSGEFKAYTNGFEPKDFIYPAINQLVIKRCESALGSSLKVLHGMLLKEKTPWSIHTDYVKGDSDPNIAILIPLNTEELNTHTVVFNEKCSDSFPQFILNNNKLEHNAKDLYNSLCSHETVDHLEYVSLLAAYKWIPGSMIYWDRRLLHSSDDFLKTGIKEKTALVIFTTKK